LSRNELNMARI